jgi:hypothetical protein
MATTSKTTAVSKTSTKKPAAVKKAAPALSKKPAATKAKPEAKPKKSASLKIGAHERYKMTEVAAYFIAEKQGFTGNPVDFWLQAEQQISKLLKT